MLYGIKDSANLQVISNTTNKPVLYANYAKTSSIDFTADSVYAYNKTTKAVRWDKQREGTFKTEMEIFDVKWIALLFGTDFASASLPIAKRAVLKVTGGTATLTETPKTGSLTVFKVDSTDQITHIKEQLVGTPASTADTYSISGLNLTLNTTTTFASDGYISVYYLVDSTVSKFTVDNVSFPGGYKIYADSAIRGTDQVDKFVQYQLLNVKPKSNVSLTMDADNVSKLSIEWDILADSTGNMMHFAQL